MKKSDIILFFSVVLVGLAIFAINKLTAVTGDTVIVTLNGEIFGEYPLYKDAKINVNDTNTIKIENGYVYMENASCPDHLCVHQGKAKDSSKKIVCLPNKVTVEVTKQSEIDKVVR